MAEMVDLLAALQRSVDAAKAERRCPTRGCGGDARYASPGRGHMDGCHYPADPTPESVTGGASGGAS